MKTYCIFLPFLLQYSRFCGQYARKRAMRLPTPEYRRLQKRRDCRPRRDGKRAKNFMCPKRRLYAKWKIRFSFVCKGYQRRLTARLFSTMSALISTTRSLSHSSGRQGAARQPRSGLSAGSKPRIPVRCISTGRRSTIFPPTSAWSTRCSRNMRCFPTSMCMRTSPSVCG